MSTSAQIAANQENAKLSTGPTSEAGAARSSKNAIRHGLTGTTIYLTPAEEEPYRAFREDMFFSYVPKGTEEEYLVDALIDSRWRIAKISQLEFGLYALGEIEYADQFSKQAAEKALTLLHSHTFSQKQKEFEKLNRYQGRLQRQATKDLTELKQLQSTRKAHEVREFEEAAALVIQASMKDDHDFDVTKFGFVWSTDDVCEHVLRAKARNDARAKHPSSYLTHNDLPKAA
jgi:hypothetical protein